MHELLRAGKLHGDALTCDGTTISENCSDSPSRNHDVIRSYTDPMKENAGFAVLRGNLCDAAIMKTSVIGDDFRQRYLSRPGHENVFEVRAIVFEGPEDYHARINDAALNIDADCILVIRGCGPVGYPGSAEVVNMQPPDQLIKQGIRELPTLGDGRQSGTSGSPSILNVSPESAGGGGLAILVTGDTVRIDLNTGTLDVLLDDDTLDARRQALEETVIEHQTPWQEIYRSTVGQLAGGGIIELAAKYQRIRKTLPRHSH